MSLLVRVFYWSAALAVLCTGCSGGGTGTPAGAPTSAATSAMTVPPTSAPAPGGTPTSAPVGTATSPPVPVGGPTPVAAAAPQTACRFQTADQPLRVGFCETFDKPNGTGTNSGDLDGTLWGVSRALGSENVGQGQYWATSPTTMNKCGQMVPVQPPGDVAICNGLLVDAQTDEHGVTSLAMYPKQPFDITGRTGTIAFDVSNDTHGTHRAWPELWMTDVPVPTPFTHTGSLQLTPPNGFGIRFGGFCKANQLDCRFRCPEQPTNIGVSGVSGADVVNNYLSNDSESSGSSIAVQTLDCVKASSGPGNMNHFEVRVAQNEMDVYGTDAGTTTPLRHIAVITNFNLTLTHGLVWLEDVHYNGDKDGPDQGTHTFTWANFGFDGPILARDLAFDALNNTKVLANGWINIGWPIGPATSQTLQIPGVYNIASAAKALLTFDYFSQGGQQQTINYRLNNASWHAVPWPYGACTYVQNNVVSCGGGRTYGVPVALSELQPGTNTVEFTLPGDAGGVSNLDLILAGAGGVPTSPLVSN